MNVVRKLGENGLLGVRSPRSTAARGWASWVTAC